MEHQPGNNNPSAAESNAASVSNMPTATPIASEIISDFKPDPGFEITTLEKATFDCNDLFMQDDTPAELVQMAENGKQQQEPIEKDSQDSGSAAQVSQDSGLQQSSSDERASDKVPEPPKENGDPIAERAKVTGSAQGDNVDQLILSSTEISNRINDCQSSSDKHEIDTDHLTATISVEESIAASALVQVAEGQSFKLEDIATSTKSTKDSNNDRLPQYSAIETPQLHADRVPTAEESEHANYLFSLSQTSEDAQMEKVIENIVELGEGHEFSHSLSQVEDKEKLLESIHREITSVQSSIDLIADVASKQQSIEISPSDFNKPNEDTNNQNVLAKPTQDQNPDLKASALSATEKDEKLERIEDKVISVDNTESQAEDATATKSSVPMEIETTDKPQEEEIISETVDATVSKSFATTSVEAPQLVEVSTEVSEVPAETKEPLDVQVEPIIQEPPPSSDDAVSEPDHAEPFDDKKEILADVVVEPIESTEEVGKPLNLEPVVEEASSADESEQQADKKPTDPTNAAVAPEESTKPEGLVQDFAEKVQDVPPVDEVSKDDAATEQPPQDSGRRKSGRKVKPTKENAEEAASVQGEKQEPVEETVGRSSRSLRVRLPKRPLEEESPKVEPSKKQVKRSRGAQDDLNKSCGPSSSTPTNKLPSLKSRMTISTADPSTRPGAHKERATMIEQTDKKYVCQLCGYATDRLNNLVYHSTKTFCQGKTEMAEIMKNDIIKQMQAKGKRRQVR